MVSIVTRRLGNGTYYYLQHNIRKGKKHRELYLGKEIPDNIEEVKQEFLLEFYRQEWTPKVEAIRKKYSEDRRNRPRSIRDKDMEAFSIKFTYNTQRIEGSTLSLRETADLLHDGITPRKPINDTLEAMEHQKLFLEIIRQKDDLSLETICMWHGRLFGKTKGEIAGRIRDFDVRIAVSKFIPPPHQSLSILLRGFFIWYRKAKKRFSPVELAALVHLKFVSIHPFGDGNGRVSRLMINYVLNSAGYPMFDIGYLDRRSYYNALERASTGKNDVLFLQWFMRRYFKENRLYVR